MIYARQIPPKPVIGEKIMRFSQQGWVCKNGFDDATRLSIVLTAIMPQTIRITKARMATSNIYDFEGRNYVSFIFYPVFMVVNSIGTYPFKINDTWVHAVNAPLGTWEDVSLVIEKGDTLALSVSITANESISQTSRFIEIGYE